MTFAYARDGCFPGSWWIKRVNKHTQTPVNAVWFNTTIGICLTLLIFGGTVAIGAIFSIAAVAAFVAFTIPIFIRVFFVGNRFRPGPWNLGRLGIPIGIMACAFVMLMVPVLCFPALIGSDLKYVIHVSHSAVRHELTFHSPSGMNWTPLVYGAPMLCILIWWVVDARKWFKGPKVNIEHRMLGREENVIEGEGEDSGGSSANSISKGAADSKAANLA